MPHRPADSTTSQDNADDLVAIPRATVGHWAEVVEFALDNPPEAEDALIELAEGMSAWLDGGAA